jgi:hypothetical protein
LAWSHEFAQANLPGFSDELESILDRSYEDIVNLVDDAGRQKYPSALSPEQIRALNRLGAGLRDLMIRRTIDAAARKSKITAGC